MVKVIDAEILAANGPLDFTAEASELGFAAGEWPETLQPSNKLGNGLLFVRKSKKLDSDGDLMYVRYLQAAGCLSIVVYND